MLALVMEGNMGVGGTGLRRDAEFRLGMQLEVPLGYCGWRDKGTWRRRSLSEICIYGS